MSGPHMTSGGQLLTVAGAIARLFGESAPSVPQEPDPDPGTTPTGSMPTAGLSGWWDAASLSPGALINSIADKSSSGKIASASGCTVMPRQSKSLPGIYSKGFPSNYSVLHPVIRDFGIGANGLTVGSGGLLTVMLAWSRPNKRQPNMGALSSAAVPLLSIGGTVVLSMTANGDGNDVLTLFPNGAAVTGGKLELRHTHAARVAFSSAGVDVWLDGTKVITAAANSLSLGATANVAFLDSAQCIFHEAAVWSRALTAAEHADLSGYLARWSLGPRRAINGLIIGQSNADNLFGSFVAWPLINDMLAYWTGVISSNILWRSGSNGNLTAGATVFSGQGLYDSGSGLFLDATSGAANVDNWPLGGNGNNYMAAIDAMTADQRANLRYVAWYWSEADSAALTAAKKATYFAAMKRAFSLIRARAGLTADKLPIMVISALPFVTDEGCQVHREVMADLVADSSLNVRYMLAQSGDQIGQGDSWDAASGLESGAGNTAHRDPDGASTYLRRWAVPIARATVAANAAAGTPDAVTAIDASVPVTGGPKITSAVRESATSVLVTVQHDGGNDLAVPLRATQGVGWSLKDGSSIVKASACARVSATQLRLTFPAVSASGLLHYGYGSNLDASGYAVIGRGNAVTDNFSAMTLALGWRIGADLGVAAQPNNPLQATTYGIALG